MSTNDSGLIGRWGAEVARTFPQTPSPPPLRLFRTRFLELRMAGWVPFALSIGYRRFYFHVSRATFTVPDSPRWKLVCDCHRQSGI